MVREIRVDLMGVLGALAVEDQEARLFSTRSGHLGDRLRGEVILEVGDPKVGDDRWGELSHGWGGSTPGSGPGLVRV